jgi:hypothetical protein
MQILSTIYGHEWLLSNGAPSGRRCSRVRREAIAKPVSHAPPPARSTETFAGLMSLWTRPRSCASRSATTSAIAMRRNCAVSNGRPRSRSSGSPPGSSSTNMARSPSRTNSSGRAAHVLSRSSLNACSLVRRSRLERDGRQDDEHGPPSAVNAQAPRSAQDAFAVLRQYLKFIRIHAVQRIGHFIKLWRRAPVAPLYVRRAPRSFSDPPKIVQFWARRLSPNG